MIKELSFEKGHSDKFNKLNDEQRDRYVDILYEIASEEKIYLVTIDLTSKTYNNDSVITKFSEHGEFKKFEELYII